MTSKNSHTKVREKTSPNMSTVAAIKKISTLKELKEAAKSLGVAGYSKFKKDEMEELREKAIEACEKGPKAPISNDPRHETKWTEEMVRGITTLSKLKELAKSLGLKNLGAIKKEDMETLADQVVDALLEGKAPVEKKSGGNEATPLSGPTRHQVTSEASITNLKKMAKSLGVAGFSAFKKETIEELREKILEKMDGGKKEEVDHEELKEEVDDVLLLVRAERGDDDLIVTVPAIEWELYFTEVAINPEKMADKINEVVEMVHQGTETKVTVKYQKEVRELDTKGCRVMLVSNFY